MKKKNNLKKRILVACAVFFLFILVVFFVSYLERMGRYKIFVFNKEKFLLYKESNREWFSISEDEFLDEYKDKRYTLYVKTTNKGSDFKFKKINGALEMVHAANNIITRYTLDNYFAYSGNAKVKYIPFVSTKLNSEDEKNIFKRINNSELGNDYNLSYMEKYYVNFDTDINRESIYIITNLVGSNKTKLNTEVDKLFSIMFYVDDDGKMKDIYSKIVKQSDASNICLPTLEGIFLFDSDRSVKLISYCNNISDDSSTLNLYNYKNNKFTNISINK